MKPTKHLTDGESEENAVEGTELKDLTYSTFGLIIAYLLPGAASLLGLYYVSDFVCDLLNKLFEKEQGVIFSILLVCGLGLGMILNAIRRAAINCVILYKTSYKEKWDLQAKEFKHMGRRTKVADYRALMEEEWRQHQFYAAMAMVFFGLFLRSCFDHKLVYGISTLVVASALVVSATKTYRFYISVAKTMLGGSDVGATWRILTVTLNKEIDECQLKNIEKAWFEWGGARALNPLATELSFKNGKEITVRLNQPEELPSTESLKTPLEELIKTVDSDLQVNDIK